ncbi:MAG: DUF4238 domain-containing protein [Acidimicrobiales bacterium]
MTNKLQHYVPQWYLKSFGSNSERIKVIDRVKSKSYVTHVSNAAAETGYYDYVDANGEISRSVEADLSALEHSAAKAIRRMLRSGLPISEAMRHQICAFVAAQYLRGPRRRDAHNLLSDQLAKATLTGMSKVAIARLLSEKRGCDPSPEEVDKYAKAIRNTDSYRVEATNAPAKILAENLESIYQLVVGMYSVEVITQPMPWLFTSDDPVCLVRQPANDRFQPWEGIGIGTADEILLPLDRSSLLVLHNSALHDEASRFQRTRSATQLDIERYFFILLEQSYKYIFLHPDEDWLDPAGLPPPSDPIKMSGSIIEMARMIREHHEAE